MSAQAERIAELERERAQLTDILQLDDGETLIEAAIERMKSRNDSGLRALDALRRARAAEAELARIKNDAP